MNNRQAIRDAIEHMIKLGDTEAITPLIHSDVTMQHMRDKLQQLKQEKHLRDQEITNQGHIEKRELVNLHRKHSQSLVYASSGGSLVTHILSHSKMSILLTILSLFTLRAGRFSIVLPLLFYLIKRKK
jgi:hypothetical protein